MKMWTVMRVFSLVLFLSLTAQAQKINVSANGMKWFKTTNHTVCYAATGDAHVFIPPPHAGAPRGRVQAVDTTGKIKVTYSGFSPQAQKAFQYAVNIWRTLIVTEDTIYIQAVWERLGTGVLGSASPAAFYASFAGAPRSDVYYPIALAEKISHKELNSPGDPDITASFSSAFSSWYYGTDGQTPAQMYDLVSVVLHEIGHGLGVYGFYEDVKGTSDFSIGVPGVFDTYMETMTGTNILTSYSVPSKTLTTNFTSGTLYFNSPLVLGNNSQSRGKLWAPTTFSAGSSIYHLDENTYPQGDINSLMTPFFNTAEAIHNPGPIVMGLLKDVGWNNIYIDATKLPNTEDVADDFTVTATIQHDTAYDASSVKLMYTIGSPTFTPITMTPTGNPDEYSAVIPKPSTLNSSTAVTTYYYYLSTVDNVPRTFTVPGQQWAAGVTAHQQYVMIFTSGPDTQAPKITHTPVSLVKKTDTKLTLEALITDNIGVESAYIQYSINGVAQSDIAMTLKSLTDPTVTDSTYTGTITLPALNDSDVILYRIKATDISVAHNVAYKPATDYYTVTVESFGTVQDSYSNDFNTASSDFQGDNLFSITTATGFSDGAINTTHPYPIANPKDSISYTYQLKIPIKISATNPTMTFDEIALVEPNDTGSVFGGSGFYDYVVVEGSTNNGTTWKPFLTGYNCRAQSAWLTQWNSSNDGSQYPNSTGVGKPSLMVTRTINLTSNGKFKAGDQVVIRFRLLSDQLTSGWGWIIDNLKIQVDGTTTTTGVEPTVTNVTLYPNPVASEYLTISAPASLQGVLSLTSVQGQQLLSAPMQVGADGMQQLYVGNLSSGLYVVKIQSAKETVVRKIVVVR